MDPFEDIRRDPLFRDVLNFDVPLLTGGTGKDTTMMPGGKQTTTRGGQECKEMSIQDTTNWITAYARAPPVDIVQRDQEYQINFDVPGVRKEDIKVNLCENRQGQKLLTIHGERKDERTLDDKDRGTTQRRAMYGRFSRTLTLPENCDAKPEKINAKVEHGVLKVIVPRTQEPEKRKAEQEIRIA